MAPPYKGNPTELLAVNTIRAVSADQPQAANSGHPGAPMGCAPMAYLLWTELMKYSGKSPKWINRDRFVLSNGHACALQYTMLHLAGYDVSAKDLSEFRKFGSKTPGHPECFVTDGEFEPCGGWLFLFCCCSFCLFFCILRNAWSSGRSWVHGQGHVVRHQCSALLLGWLIG